MWMDGLREEEKKSIPSFNFKEDRKNITGEEEFMTPLQGIGMGVTTSPEQGGLL